MAMCTQGLIFRYIWYFYFILLQLSQTFYVFLPVCITLFPLFIYILAISITVHKKSMMLKLQIAIYTQHLLVVYLFGSFMYFRGSGLRFISILIYLHINMYLHRDRTITLHTRKRHKN